jgi:hypothetical protein
MPSPYKRMDGRGLAALKRCDRREKLFCQRSVFLHRQSTHPVGIIHCKLRLAVREKKVSQHKSDCCGRFVVFRFMSRARTARVKVLRAIGYLIRDFTV